MKSLGIVALIVFGLGVILWSNSYSSSHPVKSGCNLACEKGVAKVVYYAYNQMDCDVSDDLMGSNCVDELNDINLSPVLNSVTLIAGGEIVSLSVYLQGGAGTDTFVVTVSNTGEILRSKDSLSGG